MREIVSNSERDTELAGERFGASVPDGAVVAMYGELGSGKTAFVRGMARGMGIDCRVSSPTFTIVNEYLGARAGLVYRHTHRRRRCEGPVLGRAEAGDRRLHPRGHGLERRCRRGGLDHLLLHGREASAGIQRPL